MFTKQELQVVLLTLTHRHDWLKKNLANTDTTETHAQHQQTLTLIESALAKLNSLDTANPGTRESFQSESIQSGTLPSGTLQSGITRSQPGGLRAQVEPAKIRALIVDDDTLITSLVSTYLMNMGIQKINIAEDGRRAITMLYDAKPVYDLVLCDWNMPIKSGLDVHNAMRASDRYQDTCFMLVTAVTEAKQIRAAIEDGVDDYVVKPIDQYTLNKKIARMFPKVTIIDSKSGGQA